MYIRHFVVKNFMSHRESELDLHPITVLVGANGGGKSAFFDALTNFSMVARGPIPHAFGPGPYSINFLRYRGASSTARIAYRIVVSPTADDDRCLEYEISYASQGDSYSIYHERLIDASGEVVFDREDQDRYSLGAEKAYLSHDRGILAAIRQARLREEYVEVDPLVTMFAADVSRISKYRLEPANLARPSKLPEAGRDGVLDAPRLSYEGEGLSSVLYHLTETADPNIERIIAECSAAIPGLTGFEFNTIGVNKVGFSAVFSDARGTVPAANLSDGTLTFIGLVSLLTSTERNPVICLEEPENGLTPTVLRALYRLMESAVTGELTGAPLQLLMSSHSPYTVCEAWNGGAREYLYQMRSDSGFTVVRSFADLLSYHEVQLEKDKDGQRTRLNLRNAELIIEGYLDSMP